MPSLHALFGQAVRRLRLAAGHSQESFADAIGVHRNYIGTVERGETNISLENISRIAQGLKQPVSALFRELEFDTRKGTADVTPIQTGRPLSAQPGRALSTHTGRRLSADTSYQRAGAKSERGVAERRVLLRQHVAELLIELNELENTGVPPTVIKGVKNARKRK